MKFYAAVIAVSCVLISCDAPKKEAKTTQEAVKSEVVAVQKAVISEVAHKISYNGNIEPFRTNNISPAMPMRIDEIFVEVSDNVVKGEKIAELDKNQLIQQQLQFNNIAADLSRTRELYDAGGISKQQLDQLQLQYDVAKKALNYLEENSTLLSPINGVITARNYDKGDMYGQQPIVTVMQIDSVKVRINISEKYFTDIKKGMGVEILSENYPDKVFMGNISLIFPLIDATTRSFTAEVTIPNTEQLLRPGMYTIVNINLGKESVITVPDIAVQKQIGSNERFVYVVIGDKAIRRSVTVGEINNKRTEIAKGINAGDNVVIQGASRLIDGSKVIVK